MRVPFIDIDLLWDYNNLSNVTLALGAHMRTGASTWQSRYYKSNGEKIHDSVSGAENFSNPHNKTKVGLQLIYKK